MTITISYYFRFNVEKMFYYLNVFYCNKNIKSNLFASLIKILALYVHLNGGGAHYRGTKFTV